MESAPWPRPGRQRSPCSLLPLLTFVIAALIIQPAPVASRPAASVQLTLIRDILSRGNECIYHNFARGDFATFEVFIVDAPDGGRPHAAVQIEGPVASPEIGKINEKGDRVWDDSVRDDRPGLAGRVVNGRTKMGAVLQDWLVNWQSYVRKNRPRFQDVGIIHHSFHIDYTHSGDEEDAVAARADLSRKRNAEAEERRKRQLERKEAKSYSGNENVDDEDYVDEGHRIEQVIPDWVEPYQWTKPIKAPGWYRICVQADNRISVEMDIRSGAELGGVNPKTFHVYTHEEREEIELEERIMGKRKDEEVAEEARRLAEELEKLLKDQVKDYDLQSTRKLMNEVNALVSQMVRKQQDVHHRIKKHEDDAVRSRMRIMRSGIIETVLYLAITLFQVYTIHNWLLGSNMLGR